MLGISVEGFDDVMVSSVVVGYGPIVAWAEAESTLRALGPHPKQQKKRGVNPGFYPRVIAPES
jgi:hypothetical protein